jgi:two-component system cell cycle sensor histidine kinase/response regulator CckA
LIDLLEASTKRGADMVSQVLYFARGVEGERAPVQPRSITKEIVKMARDTFPKSLQIVERLPNDLWSVTGDATQLHQVLLNLCVNARDAMCETGGTLTVCAENAMLGRETAKIHPDAKPGPWVMIRVSDTGSGIPDEIRDKIFEPFFTTKDVGKGTGLGLSTVAAIVKSHGGFLTVQSAVGKGTTFTIGLPGAAHAPMADVPMGKSQSPLGSGELILLIEDELSVRTITKRTLEAANYRVVSASNGEEGVMMYARHRNETAAVLTDVMMPGMDGYAVSRALKQLNPNVPILAASGMINDSVKAGACGIELFLQKPYTSQALLKAMRQLVPAPILPDLAA